MYFEGNGYDEQDARRDDECMERANAEYMREWTAEETAASMRYTLIDGMGDEDARPARRSDGALWAGPVVPYCDATPITFGQELSTGQLIRARFGKRVA